MGSETLTGGNGADTFILRTDTEAGQRDANLADGKADFAAGDGICVAGNINLTDIRFIASGADTIIQLSTGDIVGLVLNAAPGSVQSATFTAGAADSALLM